MLNFIFMTSLINIKLAKQNPIKVGNTSVKIKSLLLEIKREWEENNCKNHTQLLNRIN